MKTKRYLIFSINFLLLLFLIPACNQPNHSKISIKDGGFFSKAPCGPPCFLNIIPGTTNESDTENILKTRGLLEICDSFNYESNGGQRGIKCNNTFSIYFQKLDKVVRGIGFLPDEEISVQKVIDVYGEPNAVFVTMSGLPEYPKCKMILYFDHLTTTIGLPEAEGKYEVKPGTIIESIQYYDKSSYESQRNKYYSSWIGYGFYETWSSSNKP